MIFFLLFSGLLATLIAFRMLIPVAVRAGFVDMPGGRKQHGRPVPLIGGVIILPVFALLLIACSLMDRAMASLLPAVVVVFLMGSYDDVRQINPWAKFIVQCLVAFYLVIVADAEVRQLGNLLGFGDMGLGFMSVPFSVAALVLFMNALNMMDGLDGLAGGMAAVMLGWLIFAAFTAGYDRAAWQMTCLFVPLAGFLWFNMRHPWRKKAIVFLGDAGSLALAVVIGWFAIHLSQAPSRAIEPVGIIWLMAVPVIDTLTLFFIRQMKGRHPFSPDRNHLHHRFLEKGVPAMWATPFILLTGLASGSLGIQGPAIGLPPVILLMGWVLLLGAYIAYSLRPSADRTF